MQRIRFITVISFTFLGCMILGVPSAAPQEPILENNTLKLGIREILPPIQEFCRVFGEELENTLQRQGSSLTVKEGSIENEYREPGYERFDGLKNGSVHIECGPNSITAENLPEYKGTITFSNRFYSTGVKLLIRQDLSEELERLTEQQQDEKLQSLYIGVLHKTTTQATFDERPQYENIIIFEGDETSNPLEQALNAIENDDIDAIASDGIILRGFLLEGVKGKNENQQENASFRAERSPFADRGFALFPEEESLPGIFDESYGMAVSSALDNSIPIMEWINSTLSTLDTEGSTLKIARDKLNAYDSGELTTISPEPLEPLNSDSQSSGSSDWMLYSGIGLLILSSLLVLTARYRDKFYAKFSSNLGSLSVGAENQRSETKTGITANEVISREGGLKIREGLGQGVAVTKADIRKDIDITSDTNPSQTPTLKPAAAAAFSGNQGRIDCQELVAGRDITFIQFIQDIGLGSRPTSYSPQVDRGFSLWKSLLDLRYSAEDLWELQSEESLLKFSRQLKKTRKIVHEKKELLSDGDRSEVFSIVRTLGELSLGRTRTLKIRELQSEKDIQQLFAMRVIEKIPTSPRTVLRQSLDRTEDYRFDYEQIVEKVGVTLKQKLRHISRN